MAVLGAVPSSGNGSTGTLAYPSGVASTDLVFVIISWNGSTGTTFSTPPSSVTAFTGSLTTTTVGKVSIWAGFVVGTGGGTALAWSANVRWNASAIRTSGLPTPQPDSFVIGTTSAATQTTTTFSDSGTAATASGPNDLILHIYAVRISNTTGATASFAPDASLIEATDSCSSSTTAQNTAMQVAYETQASAGATAARTTTITTSPAGTAYNWITATLALTGGSGTGSVSATGALTGSGAGSHVGTVSAAGTLAGAGKSSRKGSATASAVVSLSGAGKSVRAGVGWAGNRSVKEWLRGLWAVYASSSTGLASAAINTALDAPIVGYLMRFPMDSADTTATQGSTFSTAFLDSAKALSDAKGKKFGGPMPGFGQNTPGLDHTAGTAGTGPGAWAYFSDPAIGGVGDYVVLPFDSFGNPNLAFEAYYRQVYTRLAAWCRANGVRNMFASWYGRGYCEFNIEQSLRNQSGYSDTVWATCHNRLVDIIYDIAGPDLIVNFAVGGAGTHGYAGYPAAGGAVVDHIYSKWSAAGALDRVTIQCNSWQPANSPTDTIALIQSHSDMQYGMQMVDTADYDASVVFPFLAGQQVGRVALFGQIYTSQFAAPTAATLSTSAGSVAVTGSGTSFVSGDVGKNILIPGAGSGGTDLITTIASVVSTTSITLSVAASVAVTNAASKYGMIHSGEGDSTHLNPQIRTFQSTYITPYFTATGSAAHVGSISGALGTSGSGTAARQGTGSVGATGTFTVSGHGSHVGAVSATGSFTASGTTARNGSAVSVTGTLSASGSGVAFGSKHRIALLPTGFLIGVSQF